MDDDPDTVEILRLTLSHEAWTQTDLGGRNLDREIERQKNDGKTLSRQAGAVREQDAPIFLF